MNKKNLIFGFACMLVIAGLVFVFAAAVAPTNVIIQENVTALYDEGHFTINWTSGGGDAEGNYTIHLWMNDNYVSATTNTTITNYTFTNSTEANYTFTIEAVNASDAIGINATNISMYIDTTAPLVNFTGYTNATFRKNTELLTLNISVGDALSGVENSGCIFDINGTNETIMVSSGWCNTTQLNLTGLADGNHSIDIWANDTVNNVGVNLSHFAVQVDTTAPSLSLSLSSSTRTSLTISISGAEGTCTVDRSGASISGSTLTEANLNCGLSYAYVVTCTDSAGNVGLSSSTSFSTVSCSSSSSSTTTQEEIHSWTKITPGVATIMKDFDKEIGVKQIQIEVNNEAQNVKITVTKHEGKPAAVSVEKSGKTYRYLHINAENLEGKLERAIIRMQVEKSWMVANAFEIDNMAMFKFNENNNEWDELDTIYIEADDDYYYYDAEVDSFSYFAISEKVVDDGIGEDGEEIGKKGLGWWWIVIIAGVIIILYLISANKREISKLFKKQQNI